ncbi:MAG: hypothetical protein J6Z46_08305, partial [Lachnospiraceae bacterium]|nr:hypothetical protein [Lachnospiraceae bacterium]
MGVEIILIITGIVLLIASVIFTGNDDGPDKQKDSSFSEEDIKEKQAVLDKMAREAVERVSEEIIIHTDDELSRISNEKIMSVNEFAETNLQKINENHDHVVFLYNMLNEKDDEIKQTLADMQNAKQDLKGSVQEVVKITKQLNAAIKRNKDGTGTATRKSAEKKTGTALNETKTSLRAETAAPVFQEPQKMPDLMVSNN